MDLRKKIQFCHVISCVNNKGTLDKNEQMFRYAN